MHAATYPAVDPGFGNWLAGFIDGEGCFLIARTPRGTYRPTFSIRLRDDDRAVLEEIRDRTGLGRLLTAKARGEDHARNAKSQTLILIQAKPQAVRLCEILDAFPLRAKKARDYALWRQAVAHWSTLSQDRHAPRGTCLNWGPVPRLREELMAGRLYPSSS